MPEPTRTHRRERPDPIGVAQYVATISADLAAIARDHGLDTLGYILEMARLEAEQAGGPPSGNTD